MKNYIKYFGILALGMVACEPEFENPVDEPGAFTSGEANFSNFVAVGNSLTAGYADNALYITGQQNSFPNILAQQFAIVGGGEFTQPLMADNVGGLLLGGQQIADPRRVLAFDAQGNPSPSIYGGAPTTEVTNKLAGTFNNMGTPGAKSFHLLAPGYGNVAGVATGMANPYFARFATSPETTVIADAVAQAPTFFSLWIGNNDVLGYATSGGTGLDHSSTGNMDPTTYGASDITNPQVFASVYSQLLNQLTGTGADGVVATIPNVTDVPFFTYIGHDPLDPENPALAPMISQLNAQFVGVCMEVDEEGNCSQFQPGLNAALMQLRGLAPGTESEFSIEFSTEMNNPVIIKDETLTDISQQLTGVLISLGYDAGTAAIYGQQFGQVRQAINNETSKDLVLLTSSSVIGKVNTDRVAALMKLGVPQETAAQLSVNGITYPLQDQHVLIPSEQQAITAATNAYNTTIKALAEANSLAVFDANILLSDMAATGISFPENPEYGVTLTSDFVTGGTFSLDGIHLTPRGYAFVANKMIEAINATYHASVPKVNVGTYPTVTPSNNVQ